VERMSSREPLQGPPKLVPGDRIAILSPSWAGAGAFPAVHELGLRVRPNDLGLVPVEYPTTRQVGASAIERARDVNAAFADPEIKALMATIGVPTRSCSCRIWTPKSCSPIRRRSWLFGQHQSP